MLFCHFFLINIPLRRQNWFICASTTPNFPYLGIGIEETNAGIGIPASIMQSGTRPKNVGLRWLITVPDRFRHH
jgi:hypothetical protein